MDTGWKAVKARSTERDLAFLVANQAAKAGRYDDVIEAFKNLLSTNDASVLSDQEKELLVTSYHKLLRSAQSFRKVLKSILQKETADANQMRIRNIEKQLKKVEDSISLICIDAAEAILIPLIGEACKKVWDKDTVDYFRMLGDSYRYLAELKLGDERAQLVKKAVSSYEKGFKLADKSVVEHQNLGDFMPLHEADPIRLALALNFSVLLYEFIDLKRGMDMTKKVCDEAKPKLRMLFLDAAVESTKILQTMMINQAVAAQNARGEYMEQFKVFKDTIDIIV